MSQQNGVQTVFLQLLRGVILGFIIGVVIGYFFSKNLVQRKNAIVSQNKITDIRRYPTPTSLQSPLLSQGFYGEVIKNDGKILTVQEILPSMQLGNKQFTVKVTSETVYTHQKPNENSGVSFIPAPGQFKDIRKDASVIVSTSENPATTTNVTATSIIYFDKIPF